MVPCHVYGLGEAGIGYTKNHEYRKYTKLYSGL